MILCTVGMHDQGFNRLVKPIDHLASQIEEKVIIQRGSSTYLPQHAEHFKFASSKRMQQLTSEARVVVTHAAAGTILIALRLGKHLVLVPRLKRFGEVYDDHQLELTRVLASQEIAVIVLEPNVRSLQEAITSRSEQRKGSARQNQLVLSLRTQLEEWA